MKKDLISILPFIISFSSGLIIFVFSKLIVSDSDLKSLLINISASLIAITAVFVFYGIFDKFSKRLLHKEMFDYAKVIVDQNILSNLFQLIGIVMPLTTPKTQKEINKFLSLDKQALQSLVLDKEKLGFQIFKNFRTNAKELKEILKNSYVIDNLSPDQTIILINLLKCINVLESFTNWWGLFKETGKVEKKLRVEKGNKLGVEIDNFPNRFLLLKPISDNGYLLISFGDFDGADEKSLLRYYLLNQDFLRPYIDAILGFIDEVNKWLDLTGGEFIIDPKIFRIRDMNIEGWSKTRLDNQ